MGTAGSGVPGRPAGPPRAWQQDSGDGSQPAPSRAATSARRDPASRADGDAPSPCPCGPHAPLQTRAGGRGGSAVPSVSAWLRFGSAFPCQEQTTPAALQADSCGEHRPPLQGAGDAEVEKGLFLHFFHYSSANEGQAILGLNICRQRQRCQACQRLVNPSGAG